MSAAQITLSSTPRLPRGVRLKNDRVRSRWVLLAPERIFEIDETGIEILKRCDGRPYESLLSELSSLFNAQITDIKPDVDAFILDFASKRVLDL
jgi:pyrroloquinoline quinone biosynthesis protein D